MNRTRTATGILSDLANLFTETPVKAVTEFEFGVARSTLYNWRAGCAFHINYRFLMILQSLGYRLKLEKIETEERQ